MELLGDIGITFHDATVYFTRSTSERRIQFRSLMKSNKIMKVTLTVCIEAMRIEDKRVGGF